MSIGEENTPFSMIEFIEMFINSYKLDYLKKYGLLIE